MANPSHTYDLERRFHHLEAQFRSIETRHARQIESLRAELSRLEQAVETLERERMETSNG